jgi:serine protease Do
MKKIGFVTIAIAAFIGVIGALQADKFLDRLNDQRAVSFNESQVPIQPVSFDPNAPVAAPAFDFKDAAKKVSQSVVSVDRFERYTRYFDDRVVEAKSGSGSGVVISDTGIIVTNNHVVAGAERVQVRFADGKTSEAKVLGRDPRSDLAVLKVEDANLVPVELATRESIEVGEWVIAVGNPLGFDNTVSVGVVSSLKRNLPVGQQGLVDAIQTDAAINPGNSGGALANAQGQLIGINSAIASGTGQSVGIGFAIPIDRVKRITNDIVKYGHAKYAGLGIRYYSNLDGQLANPRFRAYWEQEKGLSNLPDSGIIVGGAEGNAAAAGIKENDVLLEIEGQKLEGTFDLNKILVPRLPGESVKVKLWSRGETKTVTVKLQEVVNTPTQDL